MIPWVQRSIVVVAAASVGVLAPSGMPGAAALDAPSTLGAFQCYEVRTPTALAPADLSLVDRFGAGVASLRSTRAVCVSVDDGGGPTSLPDRADLVSYRIIGPRTGSTPRQAVLDRFGTLIVDVDGPTRLLVPSMHSSVPASEALDHFQCRRVRRARGAPRFARVAGIHVATRFEAEAVVDVLRPLRLCAPVDKNGEAPDAPAHPEHLMCYRTRSSGGIDTTRVDLVNQLGAQSWLVSQRRELCVPSITLAPTTTTTTTTTIPQCSHGVCELGPVLEPSCGSCAAAICTAHPSCCEQQWGEVCVIAVPEVCGVSCLACGNGVLDPGEECDPLGPACAAGLPCGDNCQCISRCGDGLVGPGEVCDPPQSDDGCAADAVCASDCAGCTSCGTTIIPPEGGTFAGSTVGGTEILGDCAGSIAAPERAFAWTPTTSGTATIETCGFGTVYDTVVYVREGGCGGPSLACNDDFCEVASRVTPVVTAGTRYVIVVDGFFGDAGFFELSVVPASPGGAFLDAP